ncbi:MAG: S8/S53 family peptidase [Gammaproteobacteria bacterium]|nr:S8/S53 family peptidase [Gammaproteobacteria bacterium]
MKSFAFRALGAAMGLCACLGLAGCGSSVPAEAGAAAFTSKAGVDDAVVVAVIDSNVNPYHFDFLAAHMPQHRNADPSDDLPLDQDPGTWLPGHPGAAAFASYTRMNLTLTPDNPHQSTAVLHSRDSKQWRVKISHGTDNKDVNYYWMPGTKVIGHVTFGDGAGALDTWAQSSHGIGTSSVSTGNIYGTCPNCLLVYVHGPSEMADEWVSKQDWIDLQTNSFGSSIVGGYVRDLIYAKSDTDLQRRTIERGQSIFFSGGNGLLNDFSVPHTNLLSSQKGPDWIVTVGAISPTDGSNYTGHGKPADIASVGDGYPSAYGGNGSTTQEEAFGGTSNAAPVVAGIYAEALYRLRSALPGASRMQAGGAIASGPAGCGAANADCALKDGLLTVHELREALFRSARYSGTGWNFGTSLVGEYLTIPLTENAAEMEFLAEGHGSYQGRLQGDAAYNAEVERIVGYVKGDWYQPQDPDQQAWFVADSLCRQGGWGAWDHGYAPLHDAPAPDPTWPVRTWMTEVCPAALAAVVQAEKDLLP